MKSLSFYILICWPLFGLAQKNIQREEIYQIEKRESRLITPRDKISILTESAVEDYLRNKIINLQKLGVGLHLENKIKSPAGIHYTFLQTFNNIPIYNSRIKINMDKNGNILSLFDNSFLIKDPLSNGFPGQSIVDGFINSRNISESKSLGFYFPENEKLVPVTVIQYADFNSEARESILNEKGEILYSRSLSMYHRTLTDTVVTAGVFLPNPIVSAGVVYGAPYADNNNLDVPELNAEIFSVNMTVKYDENASLFLLESPYAKITEHSPPVTVPATSSIPDFTFSRSQLEFEEVNAFFHINQYQDYLQNLGFTNLVDYPIEIDAHALNGDDQSLFTPFFNPPRISFGDGGVNDAEDAHVIIHEYGHAIMHSASPNSNSGFERNAIDEGFGDYLAVSYSKSISPNAWQKVFSWDGHNPFWAGRNAATTKKYPAGLGSSYHSNGEIWSSTLMQINEAIGREITDQILLQSAYSYAENMKMPQAAKLFIEADQLLNQGENLTAICPILSERGLYTCLFDNVEKLDQKIKFKLLNSSVFAEGIGNLRILLPVNSDYSISLTDFSGKKLKEYKINSYDHFDLHPAEFQRGVYFIKIESKEGIEVFKIIKF